MDCADSQEMVLINDAFRFELDLNATQRDLVARSAGVARYTWNWGLAERKRLFEQNEGQDRFISAFSQINAWVKVNCSTVSYTGKASSSAQSLYDCAKAK